MSEMIRGLGSIETQIPDWEERLDAILETMREISLQTNPQELVRAYARRMERIFPIDRRVSLSRRDLDKPFVRITRFTEWADDIDPWKDQDKLPVVDRGLFSELIYGDRPVVIEEFDPESLEEDDPAREYLAGQRSMMAIPLLDEGMAMNMVVLTREQPNGFRREQLPEHVWLSNLFGRATHNLVLKQRIDSAFAALDRELKIVGKIQRSLLPAKMPEIDSLSLAAYYRTSDRAGGDYYDFFPLADGKWGILIADVSGHGTPAAVVMAIAHSIAHMYPGESGEPADLLNFVNKHLALRYTSEFEAFITAFYGIYDPRARTFTYSSAGHNPPRIHHCGCTKIRELDQARQLPLGISPNIRYESYEEKLEPGHRVIFYTDGITEAVSPDGKMFGTDRLDEVLRTSCDADADTIIRRVVDAVDQHTQTPNRASDDRTLIVATTS